LGILQSPQFLYRIELGAPSAADRGGGASSARASRWRCAFMLLRTMTSTHESGSTVPHRHGCSWPARLSSPSAKRVNPPFRPVTVVARFACLPLERPTLAARN